jgi:hypothetical protein
VNFELGRVWKKAAQRVTFLDGAIYTEYKMERIYIPGKKNINSGQGK